MHMHLYHTCVIYEVISKAKTHNSTEQPFFQKRVALSWVGFEPTTLHFLGTSALPTELPGQGSSTAVLRHNKLTMYEQTGVTKSPVPFMHVHIQCT